MFYSQFILAKKGPLGTIWIAAHLERKLRKNQVADTDIGVSVDSILFPEMPIALRLSSHLLLGVVRIYSRKVNYLFDDCSEALLKVKQAFRSTAVDLPPEESTAPYHSITLPETFDLDDFELPDSDIFQSNYVDHHISSRDQITLQDTMEGVVYSTSKFGLDERFGDGDASGLDLDEELLEEKAATAEHDGDNTRSHDVDPQASVQARAPLKLDEIQEALIVSEAIPANGGENQMDDFDGDNEPVEYAQAPCTPGLWEEPNLSKIQETSAYDDHQEPENHNVTESAAVNEKLENASSKATGHIPHEQEDNQFEPQEKSTPVVVATEHMLLNDLNSTPFRDPADQVWPISPKPDVGGAMIPTSDGPERAKDSQNEKATHEESGVQSINNNHENWVEHEGTLNHGNLENTYHFTSQTESNAEPLCKDKLDNPEDEALWEPRDSRNLSLFGSMPFSDSPVLRPCTTNLNHFDINDGNQTDLGQTTDVASLQSVETFSREKRLNATGDSALVQGEGLHATSALESNLQEFQIAQHGPHSEVQVSCNLPNEQTYNIVQGDNIKSYTSDFPAAEQLLSVPERLSDVANNLIPETTPTQEEIVRGNEGYSGSDMLTGKKRSFTESSLMTQSFNLVDSSGLFTTRITADSVPNDDDLLSSILVGRSSVLKMKPTPPPVNPSKRRRQSAPRSALSKRKVLMDDNMVLHGDTIRQQLTNTEDIRRLRKKAPCTRPEISTIKKQFWEDELFDEAILTGLSIKLASLHYQSYDLSKIRISQIEASSEGVTDQKNISENDESATHLEAGNEKPVEPSVLQQTRHEANVYPLANEDVNEAEPLAMRSVPSQPSENNTLDSNSYGNQEQIHATATATTAAEHICLEHELYRQRTSMEIDGETSSAPNVENPVVPIEAESLTTNDVPCDTSLQMDGKMDIPSVVEANVDEIKVDIAPAGEISETKHEDVTCIETLTGHTNYFDANVDALRQQIVNLDHATEETGKNEEEFINQDNAKKLVSDGEELAYNADVDLGSKDVLLDNKDVPAATTNMEDVFGDNMVYGDELEYSAVANDTDFLNFDDVDDDDGYNEAEAAGDYTEAKRFIDNSGWSSRTKAVTKYLQIMFDKEGERGRMALGMNNLLAGKTRKEASRMFFETLVLKTKDYIHVEQTDPFENIHILPRSKLLKADF